MQLPLPLGERTKRCSACGLVKRLSEFHRSRSKSDGRQAACRDCNIEQAKRFHAENLEHCRARIKARWVKIRNSNRALLFTYLLEHPCVDCGERDPVVLEFDHLRDKSINISELANRAVAWEAIAAEMEKCEVVCANCHRRRTCVRIDSFRVRALRTLQQSSSGSEGQR